jgi:hypothetical protein
VKNTKSTSPTLETEQSCGALSGNKRKFAEDDKIFTVNLNIFQAGLFNIGSSINKRVFDLRVSINSDFITVVSNECNVNCDQTQPYRKRDSNVW